MKKFALSGLMCMALAAFALGGGDTPITNYDGTPTPTPTVERGGDTPITNRSASSTSTMRLIFDAIIRVLPL